MLNLKIMALLQALSITCLAASSQQQLTQAQFSSEEQKQLLSHFQTGLEFCESNKDSVSADAGFRINVPIDYSNPSKGKTSIFAYFLKGSFDPKRPTVMYMDGGPGGSSHGQSRTTLSFNELHFDQRGIGCSRPENLDLYRDPQFYNSLNTARDANEIRKALKIEQISIHGVSYGSVPATIFAHLFPQNTRALVLEGVLYSQETNEESKMVNYQLKKIYQSLPPMTQSAMTKYFDSESKATSIYQVARLLLYGDSGFHRLKELLTEIFPAPDQIDLNRADQIFDPNIFKKALGLAANNPAVDIVVNKMLQCRELPMKKQSFSLFFSQRNKQFQFTPYSISVSSDPICQNLGVQPDSRPYLARDFPVRIPVTYFQGTWDGATVPGGAAKHFKNVPQGRAQLLIAKKGGHTPNQTLLVEEPKEQLRLLAKLIQIGVFEKALLGELITAEELKALNLTNAELQWVKAQKNN